MSAQKLIPVMLIAGFSFGLLSNCAAESTEAGTPTNQWANSDCETPGAALTYIGKTQPELLAMLGPADSDHRFRLEDDINEFTIGLLNIYPMPENGWRQIRQQTWSADHCFLTVWSSRKDGALRSVDSLVYGDNVEF